MILYRGRNIDLDDELISEYEHNVQKEINDAYLDNCVDVAYRKVSDDPRKYSDTLPEAELKKLFEKMIKQDIWYFT